MKTIKGPGLFLAQFARDTPPHNSLEASPAGPRITATRASRSRAGTAASSTSTRPTTARPIATRSRASSPTSASRSPNSRPISRARWSRSIPAYDAMFDGQRPAHVRGDPEKRRHWAADQVRKAATVSRRLGLTEHVTFSGSLAWPYFYPYPQRPAGLIEECFAEQAPPLEADPRRLSTRTASTSASRSTRPRTCSTATRSRCSSTPSATIRAATSTTTPATSSSSAWTISASSTPITNASRCSTSRTPSSTRPPSRASTAATRAGWSAPARDRSLGHGQVDFTRRVLASSRPMISPAGRSTNGSAASNTRRSRPATAPNSSPTTSSR